MASGEGSNFSAIVARGITVDRVITNNKDANVIKRAEKVGVPVFVFDGKEDEHKHGIGWCERSIAETIPADTQLIVLAGYCKILSPHFCEKWPDKIINIHPSLLPAFAGTMKAIEQAYNHGCKVIGATVHWVTEEVDAGPIIAQGVNHILAGQSLESVTKSMRKLEHWLYPITIKKLLENSNEQLAQGDKK